MISTNDLIGLQYGWGNRPGDGSGKTDCFQLACEIHRRLGLRDYAAAYAWMYDKYADTTFDRAVIGEWLLTNARRLQRPQLGCITILPATDGAALATFLDEESLIFIGPDHNVVKAAVPYRAGYLFWLE